MSSSVALEISKPRTSRRWIGRSVLAIAVAFACFVSITAVRIARQGGKDEARPAGAIIVFGAAEYVGHPSPVYRARLDHAYDLFRQGIAPVVITTGGAGMDPHYTEGGVGRDYLIARGIPDANLIAETQGSDTAESAARTSAILRANGIKDAVVVSDAYHVFRVKELMNAQGVRVYTAPRPASVPRGIWAQITGLLREAISYTFWKLHIT